MNDYAEIPSCKLCDMRGLSVFCDLNNDELSLLDTERGRNHYVKNQTIFQEGTRPLGLYCIYEGKAKVYRSGLNGKEQIIRLATKGNVLGYQSLINGENYLASAETLEDSIICFIPRHIFFELIYSNKTLMLQVMELMVQDLKTAHNKLKSLAQKPVRARVAETLLLLKETYGLEEDNATLQVALTREDLASITGTATETLIRILSDFSKRKMIALNGKKIILTNQGALLEIAALED